MAKSRKSKGKAAKANAETANKESKANSRNGRAKVSPRAKEIEEWWSIDSLKNGTAIRGAAAIVKEYTIECMDDETRSPRSILEGYRQFLAVKKEQNDWDGKLLSPCFLVDTMWELHSQIPDYESDMKLLCGHAVQYSPYGQDDDKSVVAAREQATIDAIKKRFGNTYPYEYVWNVISIGVDRHNYSFDQIPCFLRDKTVPISAMLQVWVQELEGGRREEDGVCVEGFDYFYNRKRINVSDTPMMLGMGQDDEIQALAKDYLLIIVRDTSSGKESLWRQETMNMLADLMDCHAGDRRVDKASLVFMFKGERVFGHEHPREFNMDHYDVIHVVPVESYTCDRCVCCNPQQDLFKIG